VASESFGAKVEGIEGVDGHYRARVQMPVAADSITLHLVPEEPWSETILAMRASAGKPV
jgi:hypothetical protein